MFRIVDEHEHLMTHGQKVADGDRLGKTIVFAKNQDHARFIVQRFDANYPHLAGSFARVVISSDSYAQSLIDNFCTPNKAPHIAVSVDMLDTGIDVPEVVNLVFFKIVRSKTKFWQMLGRGTRLCPDLFGPGLDKAFFSVFDFCQNFEFFNQNPQSIEGASGVSLSERLFAARVELIAALDARDAGAAVGLKAGIVRIASLLEDISNVPMVASELALIHELQGEDFWQDITAPMLETVRRRLRSLIKLIELKRRAIVYTDFEDVIGLGTDIVLGGFAGASAPKRCSSCVATRITSPFLSCGAINL